jgi:hypothetical protein
VRSVNLLKVAFDAELLRLRAMMARQGRRAAFAVIALTFALIVLALAEATGWLALRHRFESIPATLILLGVNLVIAAISGVLATRSLPGQPEQEALRVRRQALDAARGALAFTAAVPAVTRLSSNGRERGAGRWRIPSCDKARRTLAALRACLKRRREAQAALRRLPERPTPPSSSSPASAAGMIAVRVTSVSLRSVCFSSSSVCESRLATSFSPSACASATSVP